MILKLITAVGILTVLYLIDDGCANPDPHIDATQYPDFKKDSTMTEFTYPGVNMPVPDPFQWLEKVDSKETKKFIDKQRTFTNEYLKKSKYHDQIKATYAELWKIEKFDVRLRKGDKYFSYRSKDENKQDILYVNDELTGEGSVFFDPNTLDHSVTFHKAASAISKDGNVFAYLTSESGSNSNTLHFKYLRKRTKIFSPEKLTGVENFKITWMKNDGVFYMSYVNVKGTAERERKLFYHKLGTKQRNDVAVVLKNASTIQDFDPLSFSMSDDDRYLIMTKQNVNYDMVYVSNLHDKGYKINKELNFHELGSTSEYILAKYDYVTNYGSEFIFRTNANKADYYKLVQGDMLKKNSWKDLVPEDKKKVLDWAKAASDEYLVLSYISENITSVLQLHNAKTGSIVTTFELDPGSVKAESFYFDKENNYIYFKFESFFTPCIIYRYNLLNLPSPKLEIVKEITVPNFDSSQYQAKLVNINSDGVEIPMYITSKKETDKKEKKFTFLSANGGFSVSLLPYFSVNRIVVLKHLDGIHAVANIRGGGEKGKNWHRQGCKLLKQNSMNDFQAAAEYLINEGYTSSELLAADGGASGTSGPLIGASLNQRPDLFKVVIAEAGAMDMLRFNQYEGGRLWVPEYGSLFIESYFLYLYRYSPLHNVKMNEKKYPATMLITSVHDDRVPAQHSLKFIAALQSAAKENHSIQENPLIIKIAKSGMTSLEEAADITSFIVMNTGIEFIFKP